LKAFFQFGLITLYILPGVKREGLFQLDRSNCPAHRPILRDLSWFYRRKAEQFSTSPHIFSRKGDLPLVALSVGCQGSKKPEQTCTLFKSP